MATPFLSATWYRIASFRPQLREHAELHRHQYRGRAAYVLQDHAAGRSYQLTPEAYLVVALMDGQRSVELIWTQVVERLGEAAPTQDDVMQLLARLHGMDLLQGNMPPDALELFARSAKLKRSAMWRTLFNPLSIRVPLWNPESFLERTSSVVCPLFSWIGAILWLTLVLPALILAGIHWTELSENVSDHIFASENLIALALIYPGAKLVHEFGHAYAVKAFGGTVPELGAMLLVFFPSPYVDASAATGFRRKSQRIVVGAAGVMAEVILAALALYLWLAVEPGAVRSLAYNLMLIAGISTVLFNANPLLRYDGYYILADLIEIPNLGQRASRYWGYLVERYAFKAEASTNPAVAPGERPWFVVYAPAAYVYRLMVSFGIALFIANQYFIIGVILGLWSFASGVILPSLKLVSHVVKSPQLQRQRARAISLTATGIGASLAILCLVPMPLTTTTEGVVWLPDDAVVRAGSDGFVDRIVAKPGVTVQRGERLIEANEPIRQAQAEVLRARRIELERRLATEQFADRVQAEVTRVELGQVGAELAREEIRLSRLAIASPADGLLVLQNANDLPGRYVREGEIIGYVTPSSSPRVRVSVRQDDVDLVRHHLQGTTVKLVGYLDEDQSASLIREVPSGRDELPSKALSTAGGGQIGTDPRDPKGLKTLQRVFQFDLILPVSAPTSAFGSRVYVRFVHTPEPLAFQIYRRGRQLLLSRLHA